MFLRVFLVSLGVHLSLGLATPAWSQNPFLKNPLQVEEFDDPLLPQTSVNRPLSPLEKFRLEQNLDQLNQEAMELYEQGKVDEAFAVWYRELKLRQKLDFVIEVEALGRVGEFAWLENRTPDFRNIEERLEEIETIALENQERNLIETLAISYEQMREIDGAIALYEILLEDTDNPQQILETIANLHEAKFNYEQAAKTYEKLLEIAEAENDSIAETQYLRNLKNLYELSENAEAGIATKKRLIDIYQQQNQPEMLPPIMASLAEDYAETGQIEQAIVTYQEASGLAWSQEKFAIASDALDNLARLHLDHNEPEMALETYQKLLTVQNQSYDYYGLMNTYDAIGELYQQRDQNEQALSAFENALKFAQSLSYQEEYFQNKIQNLKS